jgi:DNA-directed RNA polymerase subunit RPC12/RpoP
MSKKPLGFVSKSGIIVAGVLLALVGIWTGFAGPVLFSPGPLNAQSSGKTLGGMKSHAQTGGTCDACHPEPWSSQDMAYRCVRCHANVRTEIQTRKGVHGLLMSKSATFTCRGCHTDHLGPEGLLTIVDEKTFPHDLTGYSLAGHKYTVKGPAFTCKDCHTKSPTTFDQAMCASCHSSIDKKFLGEHLASFGPKCLLCHDGSGQDGANFDHNKFKFKLVGAHVNVPCLACHSRTGGPKPPSQTPTACVACHANKDVHRGSLGKVCDKCHNPRTWRGAVFSHSNLSGNLAAANCYSCHAKDDVHRGGLGRACGKCHSTSSWGGANFSHALLSGNLSSLDCYSCHANDDRHRGSFGRQCGQCHSTNSWGATSFNHSRFPADHEGATCTTCHPKGTGTYTCYGCHEHSPANIASEHDGRSAASLANCVRCHSGGGGGEGGEGGGDDD